MAYLESQSRTYGGWRRAKGIGLFGAGTAGTYALLGSWMVLVLMGGINIVWYLYLGPVVAALSTGILIRWDNETLAGRVTRAVRWWWGSVSRFTTFSLAKVVDYTGSCELPGVLAGLRLLDVRDALGHRFGMVHDQRSGLLTATFRVDARSTTLVDQDQVDHWVASWGSFLANLGLIQTVRWVAATVETAPEPGTTLAGAVVDRLDPDGPPDSHALLMELLEKSPKAAADVDTRVSITFDPGAASVPLRDVESQIGEVSRLLNSLESSLTECGVGVLGRCSAAELAGIMTTAFEPEERGEVNRLLGADDSWEAERTLIWEHSAPIKAIEFRDCYQHNGSWSVTYGWAEAPRQHVESNILLRLLAPGQFTRRVTVLYRPFLAAEAAGELERQVNAAWFRHSLRAKQGLDERARDHADRDQARQAAAEEAHGAGLVRMSLYVTTTVDEQAKLPHACSDVESRGQQSKIRLKRLLGGQAAGFAVTLPVGIHPVHMAQRARR